MRRPLNWTARSRTGEIQLKYAGYIEKKARCEHSADEAKRIPADIDYQAIEGL